MTANRAVHSKRLGRRRDHRGIDAQPTDSSDRQVDRLAVSLELFGAPTDLIAVDGDVELAPDRADVLVIEWRLHMRP